MNNFVALSFLKLTDSNYKRNNIILLRLAKKNLENFQSEFKKFTQNIDKQASSDPMKYDIELAEVLTIDGVFLNSIFISIFTNFENLIFKLARIVEVRTSSAIKIEDIRGNGYIDQYRKFMHLVGKIQSAEKNEIWEEIDIYKLVRNKLVHDGGYLHSSTKSRIEDRKEFQYLEANKVPIGSSGRIKIREIYILEKFSGLTNNLLDRLKKDIESFFMQMQDEV